MRIIKDERGLFNLDSIGSGECFEYNGCVFIKTDNGSDVVNLDDGSLLHFTGADQVTPANYAAVYQGD